jgi:putative membrane protein
MQWSVSAMMDWYIDSGMNSGGWIAMTLMMGLFWGLFILGGVLIFRSLSGGRESRPRVDPLAILDERFARGELDPEEYATRKAALGGRG